MASTDISRSFGDETPTATQNSAAGAGAVGALGVDVGRVAPKA